MTNHTSGDWKVESAINPDGSDLCVMTPDGAYCIAECRIGSHNLGVAEIEEAEANARLIAAAPQLLGAARASLEVSREALGHLGGLPDTPARIALRARLRGLIEATKEIIPS